MKNLLLPFLALLIIIGCEKESTLKIQTAEEAQEIQDRKAPKIDICHYDADNDSWKVISVNHNAWKAHKKHGDVQLIDEDGDGYVTSDNGCGMLVDCDDTDANINPSAEEICGNNIDDDCDSLTDEACCPGIEIDFNGPLYVALADEGTLNWQESLDACAAKAAADGCGWYLPNKDEIIAVYENREAIGGFYQSTSLRRWYWTSSEAANPPNIAAIRQDFYANSNGQANGHKINHLLGCRCVRR